MPPIRIVALDGDETGQELLDQALRVLDPGVLDLEVELRRFDLSLENRRATGNAVCEEAAAAMRETGLGLKAATITPEGADDVGSPNRIIREAIGGTVIVRTGRRLDIAYQPVLIDATLAGLVSGAAAEALVIPCLNRDGDLLSDLVLPLFGSIAGAESLLLALDDELAPTVAMAEAPHGTAPALQGKDIDNPMGMILAAGALLHHAAEAGAREAEKA